MDEFSDEDLQVSIESDDDTRITCTLVSVSGQKITPEVFKWKMYSWLREVERAEALKLRMQAINQ